MIRKDDAASSQGASNGFWQHPFHLTTNASQSLRNFSEARNIYSLKTWGFSLQGRGEDAISFEISNFAQELASRPYLSVAANFNLGFQSHRTSHLVVPLAPPSSTRNDESGSDSLFVLLANDSNVIVVKVYVSVGIDCLVQ